MPGLKWDEWTADYGLVRDLIEHTYPDDFRDYNKRMYEAGGFYRGNGAHERIWKTPEGKAVFTTPGQLNSLGFQDAPGRYRLITMRSNDQFNTTIYGYSDRLRGLEGIARHPADVPRGHRRGGSDRRPDGDAGDRCRRWPGPAARRA